MCGTTGRHFTSLPSRTIRRLTLPGFDVPLRVGGHAIIATFAPGGPQRCSGLMVSRYDANSLAATLGEGFELIDTRRHDHTTPWGAVQKFQFSTFRRSVDV